MISSPIFKLFTRFSMLTGGRLAGAAAAFVSSLLIARQMGADTLGELSVIIAVISVLSVFLSAGFPAVATIFAVEYTSTPRDGYLKGFIRAGWKHAFFGSMFCVFLAAMFLLVSVSFISAPPMWGGALTITTAFLLAVTVFNGAVLVGLERQIAGLLPDTLLKPIVFLLLVVMTVVAGIDPGSSGLLALFATSAAVACLLSYVLVRKTGFIAGNVIQKSEIRRWRTASYPWIITSLVWDLFIELHIILTSFLATSAQVAVLHIAFRFRVLAGFGLRSIYSLFLPRIIACNVQGNTAELKLQLQITNILASVYASAIMIFFALFSSFLMGLFGQEFEQGWLLLLVVSSTILVRAVFGPAPAVLAMTGHQKPPLVVMLACLAFSLTASILTYPVWGLLGIALSYATANFAGSLVLWLWAKALTGIDCSLFSLIGDKDTFNLFRERANNLKSILQLPADLKAGAKTVKTKAAQ